MNAKIIFLANKDLAAWWANIAHDSRFELVLIHAQAVLMESCPEKARAEGAEAMKATLLDLPDNEGDTTFIPSPGLHHFPDSQPPKPVTE